METLTPEDTRIKALLKQAMLELIQEQRELFTDLFAEVIEDLALANAIQEGKVSETVDQEDVYQTLDGVD